MCTGSVSIQTVLERKRPRMNIMHSSLLLLLSRACVAYARDTVVDVLVIPSTCIRGRDIVIAPLVCVSVCVSPLNS